jgi:hypothetical protein
MTDEIESKLEKIKTDKAKKKAEERVQLNILNRIGLRTRHFRTPNHGNITVLYNRVNGSRYEYHVQFSFCSPTDSFSKRHGRLEAFKNKAFVLYHPEEYPTDGMLLDFLKYISSNSTTSSKTKYGFEKFYGFPRWLPEFLIFYPRPLDFRSWLGKEFLHSASKSEIQKSIKCMRDWCRGE